MTDNQRIRRSPKNTENPFAQISREMLQNKTLSYEARGLLSYLLSKSGDWEARVSDLRVKGAGRDKVYRIIAELQGRGYISERQKFQDEKGQWQWTAYEVYETPSLNPCPEKPYTDEPNAENTEIYKTKRDDIESTKEREEKREEHTASRSANAGPVLSPNEKDVAYPFVEQRLPSSPQGAKKSARTDKAPARGKAKSTPPPSDGGAVPPTPQLKSILAWIIDDTWSGQHSVRDCSEGMSKRLIGPLMGTAKDKDKRLEPKATEEEIYAFGRWYRYYNPQLSLPSDGKVASWFGQFRAHPDYARRVQDAHLYVERLYRNPPPIVPEEPKVYVDPAVGRAAVQEALRALYPNRYSGDAS